MCDCKRCAQVPVVEADAGKANASAAAGAAGKGEAGAKVAEEVGSPAFCAATIGLRRVLAAEIKRLCCNQAPMCRSAGSGGMLWDRWLHHLAACM